MVQTAKEFRRNHGEEVSYAYIFAGKRFNFLVKTNNIYVSWGRSTLITVRTKNWAVSVSQYGRPYGKPSLRCYAAFDNWAAIEQDLIMLKLAGILTI